MSTLGDLRHLQATSFGDLRQPHSGLHHDESSEIHAKRSILLQSSLALFMRVCKCVAVVGGLRGQARGALVE